MKRTLILLAILLAGCAGTAPRTAEPPRMEAPKAIESLDIPLPGPSSEMDAAYLGLEESTDAFRMNQIKAGVLVVEVFDMYCRFCQGMAPKVDEVYELNLRSGFAGEVKMIGIGRRNTELEVATFKEKKIKHLAFVGNPFVEQVEAYRIWIISNNPKMTTLDGDRVTAAEKRARIKDPPAVVTVTSDPVAAGGTVRSTWTTLPWALNTSGPVSPPMSVTVSAPKV